MNQEVTVDLNEVKRFAESTEFHRFLLDNTASFEAAAFVLQSILDAVENAYEQIDNNKNI